MVTSTFLSVIIPLYNEEKRLNRLFKIYKYLNKLKFNYEVILVNDGSTDNTIKKIKSLTTKYRPA